MQQFNLSIWLQDKSRKIVTRDGRSVRIVCWDRKTTYWKIVGLVTSPDGSTENPFTYDVIGNESDGCLHDHKNDLFFADEEEELTEFEKAIKKLIESCCNEVEEANITNAGAKEISSHLLDLARKELEANYYTKVLDDRVVFKSDLHDRDMQGAYELGKQDALKDLPKWRKAEKDEELDCHVAIQQDGRVVLSDFVQKDEYYITLNVLKALPKEE
jgi:hypothetical protein